MQMGIWTVILDEQNGLLLLSCNFEKIILMTLEGHLLGTDGTQALCIITLMLNESG
jgi:hypothetical protein